MIKMNANQKRKLQWLTSKIQAEYGRESNGLFSFEVTEAAGNTLVFCASNTTGLRWFQTWYSFHAVIGVRGGVRQYQGNIKVQ